MDRSKFDAAGRWFVVAITALWLSAQPAVAATPVILSTTLYGGAQTERIAAIQIASDATLISAVRVSTVDAMDVDTYVTTHLVRIDKNAQKVLWDAVVPEELVKLQLDDKDTIYALGRTHLFKLNPANGAVEATSTVLSDPATLSLGGGAVAVLAGAEVVKFDPGTLAETGRFKHNIQTRGSLLMDAGGGVFVGGDSNPGTGCEPYRVPQLFHFDQSGKRDWRFYDYPGAYVRYHTGYQADSSIINLQADPRGRVWFVGQADGTNTVLSQKYWDIKVHNPFMAQGCFPYACDYPKGARKFTMIARMMETFNEVERGSWWSAFDLSGRAGQPQAHGINNADDYRAWLEMQPTCGCKHHEIAWPTSVAISSLQFYKDKAIILGGTDKWAPSTPDAWFGRWADAGTFLGILDADATQAQFAAGIPGVSGNMVGDVRGGRLVLAGATRGTLPIKGAGLQTAFGGGKYDAFLMLVCIASPEECDGPMPALSGAAKVPVFKPEPTLPTFTRCDNATGVSEIATGSLPVDFGVDYSKAPPAIDGGVTPPPAVDAGAAPSPEKDAATDSKVADKDAPASAATSTPDAPVLAHADASPPGTTQTPSPVPEPETPSSAKGCGCRVADHHTPPPGGTFLPFLLGLSWLIRRRR